MWDSNCVVLWMLLSGFLILWVSLCISSLVVFCLDSCVFLWVICISWLCGWILSSSSVLLWLRMGVIV